jgi:putative ATPase
VTLFDLNPSAEQGNPQSSGTPPDQHRMPLAARMRPRSFTEFVGQEHLVGEGRVLRNCIEADRLPSLIFWGPPGSGKTTLSWVIASVTKSHFTSLSAVTAGVNDLRQAVEEAKKRHKFNGQRTILFIDEIHRFNKSQQDAILPAVETGDVVLIGATTENPSFEVIAPLLSRSRVFTLHSLTDNDIQTIIQRAISDKERGLGTQKVEMEEEALKHLVVFANGDARTALNGLEMAAQATIPDANGTRMLNLKTIEEALQHRSLLYDKSGDQHYDLISALHKSLRGSDPDAALYWLCRMIEAGEDPLYIARRMIRFASEDVGMADPQALVVAMAAQQAVHFIGLPEGNLALAQTAVYLATAPKSNALYSAYGRVQEDVLHSRNDPVPIHLRNPVTSLMKNIGYGKDYKYAHNYPEHFTPDQQYLPGKLQNKRYYFPSEQGFEKQILARLKAWWGEKKAGLENKGKDNP